MPEINQDLVRHIPLFAKLTDEQLADLNSRLTVRNVEANQPVFWIGEHGDEMFIVQHGQIHLTYPDEQGVEITVATLQSGAFFGEISLLDGGPRTATARAMIPTGLLVLDSKAFYQFIERNPAASIHMIAVLAGRQRESMAKLRGVRNVNEVVVAEGQTFGQKAVDQFTGVAASGKFILANLVFIASWVAIHTILYSRAGRPVDFLDAPPTFFWLCLLIALESIMLTIFVLNSQKRAGERDRVRNDLDYQVNSKAQLEIMRLHEKLDQLQAQWNERNPKT